MGVSHNEYVCLTEFRFCLEVSQNLDKSGVGAGFLRELRFPLPIYIPSASLQSSSLSPEAGTIGQ
jgi:hypothetical protein